MIAMNAEVELDGRSFAETARKFVAGGFAAAVRNGTAATRGATAAPQPARRRACSSASSRPTSAASPAQHLLLVFGSLALAIAVGVPLGVAAWRWPRARAVVLGTVAILQTIPSLALLAFLIALVGSIGVVPALIALFLYALLPIVRNTHAGLQSVSGGMAQAALSLGLTPRQALVHVQLPLAAPTLLAGIKTAAVINVGTATMAAFIGAGGFGERIVAGLAVNDSDVMLAGALPAAALALVVQGGFDLVERWRAARPAALDRGGTRRAAAPRARCDNRGMLFDWLGPGASRVLVFVTLWIALRRPPARCAAPSARRRELRDEVARSAQGTRQELVATLGPFPATLLASRATSRGRRTSRSTASAASSRRCSSISPSSRRRGAGDAARRSSRRVSRAHST